MMDGLPDDWEHYKDVMSARVTSDTAWEELIPLLLTKEAELHRKNGIPADGAPFGKH